jgi:hypothetical protein
MSERKNVDGTNLPEPSKAAANREKRIMNAVANTSIILMGTLMGGFSELMVNATGAMASGMAEAFGGEEAGDEVREKVKQEKPEVIEKIRGMMSEMRAGIYEQIEQKRKEIEPFLSEPVFDLGPRKIDEFEFGLPKLTEELDDSALAQYVLLLESEDAKFGELFKALSEWMNSLPALPGKTDSNSIVDINSFSSILGEASA